MPARQRHVDRTASWQRAVHYAFKHRLGFLLAFEAFAIFALAPLIELGLLPHPLLGVTFSLILLAGMATMDDRAWTGRLIIALGLVLLPLQIWRYVRPDDGGAGAAPDRPDLLPAAAVRACSPRRCSRSRRIKMDQVLGGVVLYLNIGLTFAIDLHACWSRSRRAPSIWPIRCRSRPLHPSYFIYFSLVTLTTVGYGDIVPVQRRRPLDGDARGGASASSTRRSSWPGWSRSRSPSAIGAKPRSEHRQQVAQDRGRAAGDL